MKNLMGVKSENEPLSGTGPDRRLFDKSLQPTLENECHIIIEKF